MGLRVQFTGGNYWCPWPGKSRDDIKGANVLGKQHLLLCLLYRPVDLGNTRNSEDLGCHTFSMGIESLKHGVTMTARSSLRSHQVSPLPGSWIFIPFFSPNINGLQNSRIKKTNNKRPKAEAKEVTKRVFVLAGS